MRLYLTESTWQRLWEPRRPEPEPRSLRSDFCSLKRKPQKIERGWNSKRTGTMDEASSSQSRKLVSRLVRRLRIFAANGDKASTSRAGLLPVER